MHIERQFVAPSFSLEWCWENRNATTYEVQNNLVCLYTIFRNTYMNFYYTLHSSQIFSNVLSFTSFLQFLMVRGTLALTVVPMLLTKSFLFFRGTPISSKNTWVFGSPLARALCNFLPTVGPLQTFFPSGGPERGPKRHQSIMLEYSNSSLFT